MSEHDGGKPPAAWLDHLHEAGHWSRLVEMALQSLAVDPNDPDTHRHIAWGYAKTDRYPAMWPHLNFLLGAEPSEARNHHLAAIYYLDTAQHKKARSHIDLLLRESPNSATYHYLACIYALRCNKVADARAHIDKARALAPYWAAAAHLAIKIDGIKQRKARQAWARIGRLKETLTLDPRNADVMATIGDILLKELERPREAEGFYREALSIDPMDKKVQGKLLDSIRARSLFYRTLSLPTSAVRGGIAAYRGGRFRWVILIVAFKVVAVFLAWVVVVGVFFTPAAKIYEWFVLADITRMRSHSKLLAPLRVPLQWPSWVRGLIAFALIVGVWLLVLWKLFGASLATAMLAVTLTFGIHLLAVALLVGVRRLRARFGLWQESRRLRREGAALVPA